MEHSTSYEWGANLLAHQCIVWHILPCQPKCTYVQRGDSFSVLFFRCCLGAFVLSQTIILYWICIPYLYPWQEYYTFLVHSIQNSKSLSSLNFQPNPKSSFFEKPFNLHPHDKQTSRIWGKSEQNNFLIVYSANSCCHSIHRFTLIPTFT